MKIKALPVEVYKSARIGDCTNHGMSSRHDTLLIACPHGFMEVDSENVPDNFAMMELRKVMGAVIPTIYPAEITADGRVVKRGGKQYMMGGNFAHTSDSRFRDLLGGMWGVGAVAIHDRYETPEEYAMYSR